MCGAHRNSRSATQAKPADADKAKAPKAKADKKDEKRKRSPDGSASSASEGEEDTKKARNAGCAAIVLSCLADEAKAAQEGSQCAQSAGLSLHDLARWKPREDQGRLRVVLISNPLRGSPRTRASR